MFGSGSPSVTADSQTTKNAPSGSSTSSSPNNKEKETEARSGSKRASALIASARNSLSSLVVNSGNEERQKSPKPEAKEKTATPPHNNSAGDSRPGPNSTFRVGVTEDRNKKCRRTMEDTHAYVYNYLQPTDASNSSSAVSSEDSGTTETDNGYFAIFDGHAGTFAADWCGKKLHLILEETIRKNPNTPIPELLDATFTHCDGQLEKLPMRNSGCTAVCAVLRWEDRIPNSGSHLSSMSEKPKDAAVASPKKVRTRVLYTANVGDARIVLCRNGEAFRLSYDHKGSDENESRRVSNAGGLILNNRVNGVLAVTRALGDSYMKELVTGHPYTTETVLGSDDEFIILACDGLWDVCSDQEAVDLVRHIDDPQEASKILVNAALSRFSSDNLSCMIVRLDHAKKERAPSERAAHDGPRYKDIPTEDKARGEEKPVQHEGNKAQSQA